MQRCSLDVEYEHERMAMAICICADTHSNGVEEALNTQITVCVQKFRDIIVLLSSSFEFFFFLFFFYALP